MLHGCEWQPDGTAVISLDYHKSTCDCVYVAVHIFALTGTVVDAASATRLLITTWPMAICLLRRRWSNRTMWETLPADMRPMLNPATGLPAAGADVRVPANWRIELDSDTPELGHLEMDGLLLFERGKDVVLSVETLKMSVGEMQAGTESRPHSGKVSTPT